VTLYSYDISSAYPFHASQLLDLRDCSFTPSTTLDLSAYYGFLVGDFTVYPDSTYAHFTPFLTDRGDGVLVNFVGTVPDYHCTLDEVRTLYRYELGEFRLKHGWFIHPLGGVRPRHPFKAIVELNFERRNDDQLKSYLLKRVLTGLVGKMLETRKDSEGNVLEYGELYNPIYHAICTTRTRLQVFDFIVNNDISREELVHIGVDGVKATKYIPLPPKAPLGRWRCSGEEPAIVLSPGAVATLSRNFKRTGYVELLVDLLKRPKAYKYGRDRDIDLRNLFLNQTREFDELPRTGEELLGKHYLSNPVTVGEAPVRA